VGPVHSVGKLRAASVTLILVFFIIRVSDYLILQPMARWHCSLHRSCGGHFQVARTGIVAAGLLRRALSEEAANPFNPHCLHTR